MPADLRLWFDPVCPFCWMTSTWVRSVARQRHYDVEWRLISLRLLNAHIDYDSHFPPEYEAGHTAGLHLLRVVATARAQHGPQAVGPLYEALGRRIWESPPSGGQVAARLRDGSLLEPALEEAGLPASLAAAVEDAGRDAEVRAETEEALALTGKDVGTPIIQVDPPHGVAFFGPVISRRPSDDEAVALWDHVIGLARFPGFAELKRSLRELPQLPALGVAAGEVGVQEDWHAGSRRQKR
jgi:hypothetical protein